MEDISKAFGLTVTAERKIQENVWRLETEEGPYALKRSFLSAKRLQFIDCMQRKLTDNEFWYFAHPVSLPTGAPFYQRGKDLYTLAEWIDGDRCDFDSLRHLRMAATTLAQFHLLGRSVEVQYDGGARVSYHDWPRKLRERSGEIKYFARLAKQGAPTYFKRMYLSFYRPFLRKAETAYRQLLASDYERLAQESQACGTFIHYDVAARNFIILGNHAYLIDFDYCALDLAAVDLMRLIKRALKYGKDAAAKLDAILDGYLSVRPIYRPEAVVICALLLFPQKFWRLAKRYFAGDKSWNEEDYAKRMRRAVVELEREDHWLPLLQERL